MSLIATVKQGKLPALKRALAVTASSLDTTDNDGLTPLHHAILLKKLDMVEELLKVGANVNAQTKRGNTPLHIAVAEVPDAVPLLLDAGAAVTARNRDEKTPLDLASTPKVRSLLERHLRFLEDGDEDLTKQLEGLGMRSSAAVGADDGWGGEGKGRSRKTRRRRTRRRR